MRPAKFLLLLWVVAANAAEGPASGLRRTQPPPPRFEANLGQFDAQVQFISRGRGSTTFLTADGAILVVSPHELPQSAVLRMRLMRAAPQSVMSGVDRLPTVTNYFTGNNPAKWRSGVPNYGRVLAYGVYPGIDEAQLGWMESVFARFMKGERA